MRVLIRYLAYLKSLPVLSGLFVLMACVIILANAGTSRTGDTLDKLGTDSFPKALTVINTDCLNNQTINRVLNINCPSVDSRKVIKSLALQKEGITLDDWQESSASQPIELSPWPNIHENAKLAKVPVIMYHDILPKKEVFFDVTPEELEAHFRLIREQGLTPISLDWLISHLRTGIPLPEKPVLLTFDDGYGGHYQYVYPLLKKYGYPAVFSIYIKKLAGKTARSSITWEQLKEIADDPLITIASHSVNHPKDLRELSDSELQQEIIQSKQILEQKLGISIRYFTYPEGKADARVKQWVTAAGYRAALSMNNLDEHFAGESPDLLTIGRFGQSRTAEVIKQAWGGVPVARRDGGFNFATPIQKREITIEDTTVILISGGIPKTIHADSRYQVQNIIARTEAVAAVDGGFFSLKYLNSNVMIGPILSENNGFIAGYRGEIGKLSDRPLVLITSKWVEFVPFNPIIHNTLEGILSEALDGTKITDVFVAAAWLVKDGEAQPVETFGSLFDYDAVRHRAFWGINQAGQPVIGVTKDMIDSVSLGKVLQQLGLRDAVMLDSGASTSLVYQGESQVGYTPRPVPHAVALFPPLPPTVIPISHVGIPCVIYEDSCQ